ncbi:hypothetical protein ACFOY4_13030 [Actinomadura syzygii]|uniref:hypothetical protein n=1 Tax=Actinomadura syzygii TaxID=1427538 RepID=UPI001651D60A|nr:hypothetical protein [Actinomadura syzygii]
MTAESLACPAVVMMLFAAADRDDREFVAVHPWLEEPPSHGHRGRLTRAAQPMCG